ncbi:MAG: hypothetical protein JWQ04_1982 [Pedosphaera sp.]|nr:hypothetical protein [Pedosphaera sp.]
MAVLVGGGLAVGSAQATERYFGYTYEPETMPQGAWEVEQWATLRAGRDSAVGQDQFREWDIRHSLEYGVTDNYTVELYVNEDHQHFRDPATGMDSSHWNFDGISLENRYQVLNPAGHKVGLTLYLEPRYSDLESEVEEKIILGQRCGNWKWAVNLTHSVVFENRFHTANGEVEGSFGIARDLGKHWAVGMEARDFNTLPSYHSWESTAVYVGPVVSYRRANWWATLTVMPQIFGKNFSGAPAGSDHLELADNERVNVRLIFGIGF